MLVTVQATVTLFPDAVAVTTGVGKTYMVRGEADDLLEAAADADVAPAEGWLAGAEALPMTTAVVFEELGTKGETSLVMTSSMSMVAAESTEIFEVKVPFVPLVTGRVTATRPQLGPTFKDFVTEDPPAWLRVSLTV